MLLMNVMPRITQSGGHGEQGPPGTQGPQGKPGSYKELQVRTVVEPQETVPAGMLGQTHAEI